MLIASQIFYTFNFVLDTLAQQKANKFAFLLGFSYFCENILKAHRLFFSNQNLDTFDTGKDSS